MPYLPEKKADPAQYPDATDNFRRILQQTNGKQAAVVHHELRAARCALRRV